jgi:methionine--tRNA ligase beta chain
MVSFDDFKKLDMRIGTILGAERIPDTDNLLKLAVDFGEGATRQIVSGIAAHITPEELINKQCPFVVNLEPRLIRGVESQGMIIAVGDEAVPFALIHPDRKVPTGSKLK